MMNLTTLLPHERLVAYQVARDLLVAVRVAAIRDTNLRDQALRCASSVCLNIAEAAGRPSPADQRRVYGIARGEACEVAAAMEVAGAAGYCTEAAARSARDLAGRVYALPSGLMRQADAGPPRGLREPMPASPLARLVHGTARPRRTDRPAAKNLRILLNTPQDFRLRCAHPVHLAGTFLASMEE